MASSAKKIFLCLSFGAIFIFSLTGGTDVSAQEQKTAKEAATSTSVAAPANLIENFWHEEIVPLMKSCRDLAIPAFDEIKKYAEGKKDIGVAINAAANSIRGEYGREMQDLKQGLPGSLKKMVGGISAFIKWAKELF
jgi:predicted lipoprotein